MISADRNMVRYRSRRPDDAALQGRLREIADQRRRLGYRRLHVLPRGEDWHANQTKAHRLYRKEDLAVRRRRIAVARMPISKPEGPKRRWILKRRSGGF